MDDNKTTAIDKRMNIERLIFTYAEERYNIVCPDDLVLEERENYDAVFKSSPDHIRKVLTEMSEKATSILKTRGVLYDNDIREIVGAPLTTDGWKFAIIER